MNNNILKLVFVLSTLLLTDVKGSPEPPDQRECLCRFDYDYKVLQKLASLETQIQTLESGQQSIQKSFNDERRKIEELEDKVAKRNETGTLHGNNTAGDYFWLGMTDSETEGVWKWFHDSSNATYLGWMGTEPQTYGGPESCAVFSSAYRFGWADVRCEDKYRPVCEMRL